MLNQTGLWITGDLYLVDVECGEREAQSSIKPEIMTC